MLWTWVDRPLPDRQKHYANPWPMHSLKVILQTLRPYHTNHQHNQITNTHRSISSITARCIIFLSGTHRPARRLVHQCKPDSPPSSTRAKKVHSFITTHVLVTWWSSLGQLYALAAIVNMDTAVTKNWGAYDAKHQNIRFLRVFSTQISARVTRMDCSWVSTFLHISGLCTTLW